jgi:pimeloyl-ACP methyl ester carboxylesterase
LPGLACDAGLWAPQIAALAGVADITVGDTLQDFTIPDMARRILAAAPIRFALAGLSMGGYLAFEIMRQAPERVLRLALFDTSARPDTAEQTAFRKTSIAAVEESDDYEDLSRKSLPMLIAPRSDPEIGNAAVAMALRVGPATYIRQQQAIIARADSRPTLATITVPTLVAVGELDLLTPPPLAHEIADGIKGAKLEIIPQAAHLPTLEQPLATTRLLHGWLNG